MTQFLNDFNIASENDLPLEISYKSISDPDNPYVAELIKLFVVYGALGDSGEKILADLGFDETKGYGNLFSKSASVATDLSSSSATSDFFKFLRIITDDSTLGDPDNDNDSFLDVSKNSVINISRDDITLSVGNKLTLGSSSTTEATEIDVSAKLPRAKNNNSANKSDPDRKIYAIVGTKDVIFKGDVTFKNNNDVEDHALAIGSGGDVSFRSEASPNNPDYINPKPINIQYTGSNFAIGSESTLRMVNVNITTGGNLAISSLDELKISSHPDRDEKSTFSVGTGGKNSDPDNIYMFAKNLIDINGLRFDGRVDDVYMDAITINLKDVKFPHTSEVMARSRDGSINSGTGSVNFNGDVYHCPDLINGTKGAANNHFNGKDGHWDLNKKLDNGKSAFVIRKR